MRRLFAAGAILLCIAACSGGGSQAPRNLDNACSILDQRPSFYPAMSAAERKWGVPVSVQMATIYQESKFISNARPPKKYLFGFIPRGRVSSAYGYSQALDGTWDEYRNDQRRMGARRNNIRDAADFIGWYMDKSERVLGLSNEVANRAKMYSAQLASCR